MNFELTIQKFSMPMIKESIETSQLVYGNQENKISPKAPVTTKKYIENKHLHNPNKESLVIQLVQREEIRGHIFLIERCFVFDGKRCPILVASDLVSKADIPGASLIIFRKALQHCKANNTPLLNFSNKNSDKIYSQLMKVKPVIELDFQLGYFNLKSFYVSLAKKSIVRFNPAPFFISIKESNIFNNLKMRVISEFDETIDNFFEKLEKENTFFGRRSSEILNWRFHLSNDIVYTKIMIYKEEEVVGYMVLCERVFRGVSLLMIVDYLFWNLKAREIQKIKGTLKKAFPRASVCLWSSNLLQKNRTLGKFKGLTVPRRFSPERVKFYSTGGDDGFEENLKISHITLFDTDIL